MSLRLNLGPGAHYAPDWVNIDRHDLPHHDHRPDVLHDILIGLPFDDASCEQVYAGHLLEHIPYDRVPALIAECWRVLALGGRLAVVGPDIEAAVRTKQPRWLLEDIVGAPTPDAPGLGHEWVCTAFTALWIVRAGLELVGADPKAAELVPVESVTPPTWPNPSTAAWQFALLAVKPEGPAGA